MNNNILDTSIAMSDMDDALVSEAVRSGRPKRSRTAWIAAAAALVLIAGAAVALPKLIKPKANDISAVVPTDEPAVTEAISDEPAYNGDIKATEETAPVITEEPAPTAEPGPQTLAVTNFSSVGALNMAVRSGRNNEINGALEGLNYIYMPTKVPYGAELADITVTAEEVWLTYNISEEWWSDESDPNRFVLIWYRAWQSGALESYATSLYSSNGNPFYGLHLVDGEYIFAVNGGSERIGVWEQDGYGFEVITPGAYCEDSDTLSFSDIVRVELGGVDVHTPSEGFVVDGYMWLSENGLGSAPLTVIAYSTAYSEQDGAMVRIEGRDFLDCITDDMRSYEGLMSTFPQVGCIFKPVFLEDTECVNINVYGITDLDPIALDITLDELYDIARLSVSEELSSRITGHDRGCVLIDMVIEHRGNYVPELDEYEVVAYHCGYIIDCGN